MALRQELQRKSVEPVEAKMDTALLMPQESRLLMQRDGCGTRVHKLKLDPDPASPRKDRRQDLLQTAYIVQQSGSAHFGTLAKAPAETVRKAATVGTIRTFELEQTLRAGRKGREIPDMAATLTRLGR